MTAGKAFKRFINGFRVTRADGTAVIDLLQSTTCLNSIGVYDWLADGVEVRPKTADEPFEEDLEGVEKSNDGIIDIPKGA